ncbi:MAG: class I SAM-dependent methyltransferase [Thermoplasmata archaeon]|nr:class I SAM-dependent methyltransferase [Thermoplasmata archaeon]
MTPSPRHVRSNRRSWDREAREYEQRHRRALAGKKELAWGLWRLPESSVGLLGAVRGRRILELGCGAARWSVGLARKGGRPVGLDVSRARLDQARRVLRGARASFPLVQADAEILPFRDRSFDLVFCDWGAMTFCDPERTVPECARVLEEGGLLVFTTASPFRYVAFDVPKDRQDRRLHRAYFGMRRLEFAHSVEFQRPYGDWVELFRTHGFQVERLIETRPKPGQTTSYLDPGDNRWAARWPAEVIWRVRRAASVPTAALHRRTARTRPRSGA